MSFELKGRKVPKGKLRYKLIPTAPEHWGVRICDFAHVEEVAVVEQKRT